jgi:tripartite-type tricarboxylate transporter receptor subunit TctC
MAGNFCAPAWARFAAAVGLALALFSAPAAQAQHVCAENVVRIVSPFPAGGPTDVAARMLAEKLKDRIGQNVIVENRAGAGGATGTGYVAQQSGNGCTLLLSYDTHAVNPVLLNLPFDTVKAFKPVVMIGTIPNIIAAHPSQPYKTFAEMVTEAKKEPDRLAYATGGTGTVAHLSMKQIEQQYGMQLRNVPYRGGAPAAADLIAGHVPLMVGSVQALGNFVKAGKARALVQLGAKRHPMLPDTPTLDELGMKGFSSASWMGIFMPSATPDAVVARYHDELKAVLGEAWVQERMGSMGVQLAPGTSAELGAFVNSEIARWGDVVKRYNIKVD